MPALSALGINIDRERGQYSGRQNIFEPAQAAFDQALKTFQQRFKRDAKKGHPILQVTNLRNILEAVITV